MIVRKGSLQRYTSALHDLKGLDGHKIHVSEFSSKRKINSNFLTSCSEIGVVQFDDLGRCFWTGKFQSDEGTADILRQYMNGRKKISPQKKSGQESMYLPKNLAVIQRYTLALQDLKRKSGTPITWTEWHMSHKIVHSFISCCVRLGVVKKHKKGVYIWTGMYKADHKTAQMVREIVISIRKRASKPEPQPKATAPRQKPKPNIKAQPQQASERAERNQKSISILWGMISIKY